MGKVWSKNNKRSKQKLKETYADAAVLESKDEQEILLHEIVAEDANNGLAFNELGIMEYEKKNKGTCF